MADGLHAASELVFTSALADATLPSDLAISMREIPERGMIDLRGLPDDADFFTSARAALGLDLPRTPRTSVSWGDLRVLWLSVDQWLVLCPKSRVAELLAALGQALAGRHFAATDVSDMRTVIRLEGRGIREVLLKGCSLDLLGSDYPPGTVRRVRFAEIAALLHVIEPETIDLYVFRSYAHYAWNFLGATARDAAALTLFGVQPVPPV